MIRFIASVLLTLVLFTGSITAAAIEVPGDYASIQEAIDNAVNGDLVLVAPGTYVENINYLDKDIVLRSTLGAEYTVIDGGYKDTVVKILNGQTHDAMLDGFTIQNGYGPSGGGGIRTDQSSPWIQNCIIRYNSGWVDGGGMYIENGSPIITNCLIIHNYALVFDGAGILCGAGASAFITNNTFVANIAWPDGWGSAITMHNPDSTVSNCVFRDNEDQFSVDIFCYSLEQPVVQYCNLEHFFPGTGNISAEPKFWDKANDDYHLRWDSPCRDTGYVTVPGRLLHDFEGDSRLTGADFDMGADEFHPHLYVTGQKSPGGSIALRLTGEPGTSPVAYFIGIDLWDTPIPWWPYGEWYLKNPFVGPFMLPPMPSPHGVHDFMGTMPHAPPGPYTVYIHGVIGNKASNLYTLLVQ